MDLSQSLNLNTAADNPLFDPKFLNLEYLFNQVLVFISYIRFIVYSGEVGYIVKIALSVLAIFFFTIIAYCAVRLLEIRKKEGEDLEHKIAEYAHNQAKRQEKLLGEQGQPLNPRWVNILKDLSSASQGDWKIAIIEADSMLDSLMDQLAYKGENLGEKLKSVDREKFHSLNSAWEAHIVRNRIAHEGSKFELSLHEAKRVIALYQDVFREFRYI